MYSFESCLPISGLFFNWLVGSFLLLGKKARALKE